MKEVEMVLGPAGLEEVYRERYVALVRRARLIVGSQAVAEELVQEAFVRLQKSWDRANEPRAYVHTIVINLCRNWCARAERERGLLPQPESIALEPVYDETWKAMLRLPERYRTVLVLRFYEDLAESEIARVMDCRVGTVKSLIHRGLAKLREELK
jgi:RNA polymerase sigma factor (sigma-70 family)